MGRAVAIAFGGGDPAVRRTCSAKGCASIRLLMESLNLTPDLPGFFFARRWATPCSRGSLALEMENFATAQFRVFNRSPTCDVIRRDRQCPLNCAP